MERFTAVTHRHPPFTTRQSRCPGTSLSFYFNELNTEVQFRVVLVGLCRLQHSVQRCCCQDDGANRRGSPYGRCQSGSLRVRHYSPRYCNDFNFNQLALTHVVISGIEDAFARGKIGSLIGVEGGHSIGSSLAILRTMYDQGVRYLTLTHSCTTPW